MSLFGTKATLTQDQGTGRIHPLLLNIRNEIFHLLRNHSPGWMYLPGLKKTQQTKQKTPATTKKWANLGSLRSVWFLSRDFVALILWGIFTGGICPWWAEGTESPSPPVRGIFSVLSRVGWKEREEDYGKCGMKDGDTLLFAFLMEVSSGQSFWVLHRFKYQKKLNQQ